MAEGVNNSAEKCDARRSRGPSTLAWTPDTPELPRDGAVIYDSDRPDITLIDSVDP